MNPLEIVWLQVKNSNPLEFGVNTFVAVVDGGYLVRTTSPISQAIVFVPKAKE